MIGKHFGCRTVLRVDEDYREEVYQKYAKEVDEIVYPERLGAAARRRHYWAVTSTSSPT